MFEIVVVYQSEASRTRHTVLKQPLPSSVFLKTNTGHLPVKMVGVFKHSLFVILKHEMMRPIDVVLEVIETITQKRVSGIATATVKITQHDFKMG